MKKKISIVIPAYNEEGSIKKMYEKILEQMSFLSYDFEIIFVNDGSFDNSAEQITFLTDADKRVKCIEFSRNFNKEIAISAGIKFAQGDCVIIIDADLQHPVELLKSFLEKWEMGAEVVVGVRERNDGAGYFRKFASYVFFSVMSHIGEVPMVLGETDYRLIDRKVADEFNKFNEHVRLARGLINWLGFKREYIYFNADKRFAGKSGYSTLKLMSLAISSVITQSVVPLKLAGYLGGGITLFSVLFGAFVLAETYIFGDPLNIDPSGTALLAIMLMFLIGIVLICMGLMSVYISNIREEVSNRPIYIIRKTQNL